MREERLRLREEEEMEMRGAGSQAGRMSNDRNMTEQGMNESEEKREKRGRESNYLGQISRGGE